MPDFTKLSNFNKDANFQSVRIGAQAKLLEVELNEMQDIQTEARADIVRDSIPSGFTKLSDLDYTYMSTNPNAIKLISDSIANVNGYKITIPAGTIIALDAPPTSGTRDDLVFLEVWKEEVDHTDVIPTNGQEGATAIANTMLDSRVGVETSKRIQLKYRIRHVSGVDFATFTKDGFTKDTNSTASGNTSLVIRPQGGLQNPITNDGTSTYANTFFNTSQSVGAGLSSISDAGLYIAGKGSATATLFNTVDGYVYAIPMFKVHRRNSGGYSVSNGNGARLFDGALIEQPSIAYGDTKVIIDDIRTIKVNDYLITRSSTGIFSVVARLLAINGTTITISPFEVNTFGNCTGWKLWASDRLDAMMADITTDRDISDLRHQVSMTGFDKQNMLRMNFDKLMRRELKTFAQTKMLKTYHGIPKTPIDANTVFYASLDGTITAEVGGAPISSTDNLVYTPIATGMGHSFFDTKYTLDLSTTASSAVSLDLFVLGLNTFNQFITITDANAKTLFTLYWTGYTSNTGITFNIIKDDNTTNLANVLIPMNSYDMECGAHIRITFNVATSTITVYKNGNRVGGATVPPANMTLLNYGVRATNNCQMRITKSANSCPIISDLMLSNIDRGSTFATLPQDFIDGYARIMPAFNSQRHILSEALTAEYESNVVHATGSNSKQIATTQATGGVWTAGDTVKVTGLGGELIGGVVDTDTALARTTQIIGTSATQIYVDDVSELAVNDTIALINMTTGALGATRTIVAIDTTNKVITIDAAFSDSTYFYAIVESTASSSSPTVKFNLTGTAQAGAASTITLASGASAVDDAYNGLDIAITSGTGAGQRRTITDYVGSTKIATVSAWTTQPDATSVYAIYGNNVTGTWSGLGTNVATFTLGALATGFTAQDIEIDYSLIEQAGQGGIPEVLTAPLAGAIGSKNLVLNPSVHIRDDFAGKVAGSTTECPNSAYYAVASSLLSPYDTGWIEIGQDRYDNLKSLDGSSLNISTSVTGNRAMLLIRKNFVRIYEDKFGTIQALDKVAWLRNNWKNVTYNAYIYGTCPSGEKAYLDCFNVGTSTWYFSQVLGTPSSRQTIASVPTLVSFMMQSNLCIDANGFGYILLYTEPSDGTTASSINVDNVYIDITLNAPSGYDVLAPENPRRDNGKSNMLFVRKETKEVQVLGQASNIDGIVTYGDYLPSPSALAATTGLTILAEESNFLVTDISSAVGNKQGTHHWKNILNMLGIDYSTLAGQFGYGIIDFSADSKNVNTGAKVNMNGTGSSDYFTRQYGVSLKNNAAMVGIARYLVKDGAELKLLVFAKYITNGLLNVDNAGVCLLIPIAGRPLTKDPDGIIRTAMIPTAWRTQEERVEGIINSNGDIVPTYQ